MHYVLSTCVVARKLSGIGLSACGGLSGRPALLSSANTQIFRGTSIMKVGVGVRVGPTKSRGKSGQTRSLVRRGATVFGDPLGRIVADPRHSSEEERFVLLGLSQDQHLLAVMRWSSSGTHKNPRQIGPNSKSRSKRGDGLRRSARSHSSRSAPFVRGRTARIGYYAT